jgi:uncharacterized protein (DUF488 family)
LETSNFAKSSKDPNAVAISQGIPKWYTGRRYLALAPSWALVKVEDEALYRRLYHEQVLSKLDPLAVFDELGPDAVLLCWEAPGKFCHRRVVAEWFEEALGVTVNER